MNLLDKMRFHIEDFAWTKDPQFMFYRILQIIRRRGIPLPETVFMDLPYYSGTEKHLMKYMVPRHHGCFIDIGANVGMWTRFVAKKGYKVYAFEPSPVPYRYLKMLAKQFSNVNVYPYALGENNCRAKLNVHKSSGHNSLVFQRRDFSGIQIIVTVRTLDSFKFKNVGLIKIDTEGYEVPILKGAQRTIRENKPRLIVEVHDPYKQQLSLIKGILRKHDYKWIIRYKGSANPRKFEPQPHIIGDPE